MPELTSLTKGNAVNKIPLTLRDLEHLVCAYPIVIIGTENKYQIGKVNSTELEEGRYITLYLKTLLGMYPTPGESLSRWIWQPLPGSLKEECHLRLPHPLMILGGNSLTFESLGTHVNLSLNACDAYNYDSLRQRYDKLTKP